jgi:hypothetical protein
MAYDGKAVLRTGEKRPVYGQVEAGPGGTATIQSGGTFTLLDSRGNAVPGFNTVPVSGQEGIGQAPHVWYVLDTAGLPANVWYTGRFDVTAAFSDGITRRVDPEVAIFVAPNVEATYDPTQLDVSPLYQTRLYAADTNIADAVWSDAELNYFLQKTNRVSELAAAKALRAGAADAAKLAVLTRVGPLGNDETKVSDKLLAMAAALEGQAAFTPAVKAPDRVFSTTSGGGAISGTMDGW